MLASAKGARRVLAIEPDGDNRLRLFENLVANDFPCVDILGVVVGATAGRALLATTSGRGELTRAVMTSTPTNTDDATVEVVTLDALLISHPAPSLVMMDIEGGEADALRGATRLLRDVRPDWLLELHGEAGIDAFEYLLLAGYRIRSACSGDVRTHLRQHGRTHVYATTRTA